MTKLSNIDVRELLDEPNCAVVSTHNEDGSIHSTITWVAREDATAVGINSALGRLWPTNLQRDPRVTIVVYEPSNPYAYVEIRGRAEATTGDEADRHINLLSKKYIGQDEYPYRQPGEQRIKFVVNPERVRYVKQ